MNFSEGYTKIDVVDDVAQFPISCKLHLDHVACMDAFAEIRMAARDVARLFIVVQLLAVIQVAVERPLILSSPPDACSGTNGKRFRDNSNYQIGVGLLHAVLPSTSIPFLSHLIVCGTGKDHTFV